MSKTRRTHSVILKNRNNCRVEVAKDQPILDAVEAAGGVLPVGCRYGGCITCAAKLLSGSVRQPNGTALNKRQSQSGYILLCVAIPQENCVLEVGVESHHSLYQNPFASAGGLDLLDLAKKRANARYISIVHPAKLPD